MMAKSNEELLEDPEICLKVGRIGEPQGLGKVA
jgi:hypothetical protein